MSNWNPLYPFDEDVSPLEETAREAEWEDDCRRAARNKRRKKESTEYDNDSEDMFL